MEAQKSGTRTLLLLVITLNVYLILWQVLAASFALPVYFYGRLIELLAVFLFVALALCTPMRFEEMGILVSRRTLWRSLAMGGAVGACFVAALVILRLCGGHALSFSWHIVGDISRITYFAVAPFQEVLAKSVMLYSFELVLDKRHPYWANILSALTFAAFHVAYGVEMMLAAGALSLVTGLLFLKERAVWGCAVAHFCCGFFPLCFGIS